MILQMFIDFDQGYSNHQAICNVGFFPSYKFFYILLQTNSAVDISTINPHRRHNSDP